MTLLCVQGTVFNVTVQTVREHSLQVRSDTHTRARARARTVSLSCVVRHASEEGARRLQSPPVSDAGHRARLCRQRGSGGAAGRPAVCAGGDEDAGTKWCVCAIGVHVRC
jgi:hypothetical protein